MEKEYWEGYYSKHQEPIEESSFANFVLRYLEKKKTLIELGCGNGRDSIYFSRKGLKVIGIDQCENEINHLNEKYSSKNLIFKIKDFTKLKINKKYDYIYSRFTLHSVDEKAEKRVLNWAYNSLNKGGLFFLELRSIKDDLFTKGTKRGDGVSITNHYRRFADFDKLKNKTEKAGFKINYSVESKGLAQYKDEDPIIIRFVVRK